YTDLSVPLAGIPIKVTRVYDTLDANRSGDFGFGWHLATAGPRIHETVPQIADEQGNPFGASGFRAGTKVYLTGPDGKRVGFTFDPVPEGGLLGTVWHPHFRPDPGVYAQLSVDDVALSQRGDGAFGLYLIGFAYNPSEYTLTTTDGLAYRYSQFSGLETITDRNG